MKRKKFAAVKVFGNMMGAGLSDEDEDDSDEDHPGIMYLSLSGSSGCQLAKVLVNIAKSVVIQWGI